MSHRWTSRLLADVPRTQQRQEIDGCAYRTTHIRNHPSVNGRSKWSSSLFDPHRCGISSLSRTHFKCWWTLSSTVDHEKILPVLVALVQSDDRPSMFHLFDVSTKLSTWSARVGTDQQDEVLVTDGFSLFQVHVTQPSDRLKPLPNVSLMSSSTLPK